MHHEGAAVRDGVVQHLDHGRAVTEPHDRATLAVVVLGDHRDGEGDLLLDQGIDRLTQQQRIEHRRHVLEADQRPVTFRGVRGQEFVEQVVERQIPVGSRDVRERVLREVHEVAGAGGPGASGRGRARRRGEHLGVGFERLGGEAGVDGSVAAQRLPLVLHLVVHGRVRSRPDDDRQAARQHLEVLPHPHDRRRIGGDVVEKGRGDGLLIRRADVDAGVRAGQVAGLVVDDRFGPPRSEPGGQVGRHGCIALAQSTELACRVVQDQGADRIGAGGACRRRPGDRHRCDDSRRREGSGEPHFRDVALRATSLVRAVFAQPCFLVINHLNNPDGELNTTLVGINKPTRIGKAMVLPGDVVLGRDGGVIFIPPHLAEQVVKTSEIVRLRDMFGHQRLREQKYTPGQIDSRWSDEIEKDFSVWLNAHINELPVPKEQIQEYLKNRTW